MRRLHRLHWSSISRRVSPSRTGKPAAFSSTTGTSPSSQPAAWVAGLPSLFNSLSGAIEPLPSPTLSRLRGCHDDADVEGGDGRARLRHLTWYACGPTVYDSTHLGHARSYVNTDIIRRVLTDFFGYRIHFVMGMTDIDDKIVARARETGEPAAELARRFEKEFMEDLVMLNVLPPTVVTRVTEHIPDILAYVEEIVNNGHGYELEDGVYFDVVSLGDRYAQRLGPSSARRMNAGTGHDDDNSNDDDNDDKVVGKRDARDFALWKKHPKDDPSNVTWDSPWGPGRPGWHIECSAMIEAALGSRFDIHSGGIDLCFPHHCNEMAQAQAFLQQDEWADFFLHTGHLHISGRKMSKSLKNFITVRELFKDDIVEGEGGDGDVDASNVPMSECFRMFVLCHHYRSNITFSDDRMRDAKAEILKFRRFLERVQRHIDRSPETGNFTASTKNSATKGDTEERHPHRQFFLDAIHSTEEHVYASLMNDFNTPETVTALRAFCVKINAYLDGASSLIQEEYLMGAARVVEDTLKRLGVNVKCTQRGRSGGAEIKVGPQDEATMQALVDFREAVRAAARKKVSWGEIYKLCDQIRDVTAPNLGWKIVDGKSQSTFHRK